MTEARHHGGVEAELKDAIEGLYRVFERYPLRPSTEPCLHCHEPDEERVLHEHLLRELSAEDLSGYAGEALMVWGTEVDFKHFLPRIMEITVAQDGLECARHRKHLWATRLRQVAGVAGRRTERS